MTKIEVVFGTLAMIAGLVAGARLVSSATDRHALLGLLALVTVIATLVSVVWAYGWLVRR